MLKKTLKYIGAFILGIMVSLILLILVLRWVNPPFTSFTLQADWSEFDQNYYNLRTYWLPAEELPEHLVWAVVAAEDQLFFEHNGFDLQSIQEALEDHREGERTRGASTISQQVAKNLFLWPGQSFIRKGIEAVLTVIIELFWPKERIAEVYLNIAEFGPGLFGIGKSSQHYFQRPANQITPEMSARFAAVLPSPKRMRVNPPSPYTSERSRWILRQMNQLTGRVYIQPQEEHDPAKITDSTAVDSILIDSTLDAFGSDSPGPRLFPDTLLRDFPDTTATVSDTTDSLPD